MKNKPLNRVGQFVRVVIISVGRTLEKYILIFIPLPIWMLILGTIQLVKNTSPEVLMSIRHGNMNFFDYLEQHLLILMGAAGITLIFWIYTRKIWMSRPGE